MRLGSWITYWPAGSEDLWLVISGVLGVLASSSCTIIKAFTDNELSWDMNETHWWAQCPQAFERFRGNDNQKDNETGWLLLSTMYAAGKDNERWK